MSIININCVDQSLKIVNSPLITAGDENEDYVQFSFCSSWDGYAKIAIFYKNKAKLHYSIVGNDNRCTIPNSLLIDEGVLCIGVVGFKNDSGTYKTRTTEVLRYNIAEGALQGESIEDPTLAELFYKQIEKAEINTEGHLIITLYDETELDAGAVRDSSKIKQLCDIVYDDEGNPADFVFKYTPQELFPDANWETSAGLYETVLNTIYLFVPSESMNAPLAYLTDIEPDLENPENGTVSGCAFCVEENKILTYTFGPVKKGESVLETFNENWSIRIPDGTEVDFSNYYTKVETDKKIASIDLSHYAKTETVETELAKKQNNLTAGQNVTLDNDTISVDLSAYEKTEDVNAKLAKKQDALTAGNNVSITGNIVSVDLSAYAKTTDLSSYATQTYVQEAIYGAMEASY